MTVGSPAGTSGGAQRSQQIFPPKSSSDTEAEEVLSGDGLVLPRAGKLSEFLSLEEETDSTHDSTGNFYETLQVLKQKGKWCDSTRRCSSLSSLSSYSPKVQPQPPSGSRPPSQHRRGSSWASSITVPQPFSMTLREARKKAQWLASPAAFEHEKQQAQRQGQEEAECHRQFRAQPVPAHVYLPLYQEIVERNEARRQAGIQKRKELLLSSLKPFSFLVKEEQRKEAAQQREELDATTKVTVPKKTTRKIPRSILEPALGDKLQEAELFRKIRIQMRALNMLQMASSPIAASSSRTDPQPRTATRTWEQKLGFLQTDFRFQPRVNPAIPDYEGLYKAFQRRAAKRRDTREVTHNKPFVLRTATLHRSQQPCDAATSGGRRDSPQPPTTPLLRSRSLSGLASLSANTLPVRITDATRKRETAVRSSLEKKDKADESIQWLEMHKKKCQALSQSVTLRAKAMDPHKSLEEVFRAKLKENRNNDRKRAKEYKKELEEMKKRLQTRPYLFEQVTKDIARKEAEQRYQDTLKQAGVDEDFVRNKGQGTQAVQWKEQSEVRDCPSTHETTKPGIRNLEDLEESLE
ncbi:hypothetical protein MC885_003042 [Smutsia gigantea]|nr:hypothetical protein MC885_003042 [Smutsia gigantea]